MSVDQRDHDLLLNEVRILRDMLAAMQSQLADHDAQLNEVRKFRDLLAAAERRVVKTEEALVFTAKRRDVYGDELKEHGLAIDELRRVQAQILEWMKDKGEP